MFDCKICNLELTNVRKLSKHIRDKHNDLSVKKYYDMYLKKKDEGNCLICNNSTNYSGLNIGYRETCSRSCSSKLFRKKLKQDPIKFNNFIRKISDCVKKEWETNDQSDRIRNMTRTIKKQNEKLSLEEKKEKYGFLNKLPEKEKLEMVKLMTERGFLKWWKNATYEQKRKAWDKRNLKLIDLWEKNGDVIYAKQKKTFTERFQEKNKITELTEKQNEQLFNNLDKIFNV